MKKTVALLLLLFVPCVWAIKAPYLKNELRFGYYNRGFIYLDMPHPPSPIFWKASTKVKSGGQLTYERLLYDNKGRFAIYIGGSVSRYNSFAQQKLYAESIYPELRYWFIRSKKVDFYFAYSVAGPTILSRRIFAKQNSNGTIEQVDLGGYFIFQDYLGLGMQVGRRRAFTVDVRLVHYSNGDLLPKNPGFDVPIMVYLGYSF